MSQVYTGQQIWASIEYGNPSTLSDVEFVRLDKLNGWEHRAVESVLADLMDRRGIKWGFNDIDDDVMQELKETMARLIRDAADSSSEPADRSSEPADRS